MISVKWSPSCCHPNLCFKVFAVQYPATLAIIIIIIIITITQCQSPCPRYYILPRQWTANRDRVPFPDFHPQGKILIAKRLKSRVMLSKKKMFIGNWQCLPNCCVLLWWCLVVSIWWCLVVPMMLSKGNGRHQRRRQLVALSIVRLWWLLDSVSKQLQPRSQQGALASISYRQQPILCL